MIDVLLTAAIVALALVLAWLVKQAREQRIGDRLVRGLAAGSAVLLVAMLLTDWPSEYLAKFWADHSVVAGILSTLLLVAVAFLAFEDAERREQDLLDSSVTAAGLGGIVDHVVDVEVALAMLSSDHDPSADGWTQWSGDAKPLRWLRENRERLHRQQPGGFPGEHDPRRVMVKLPDEIEGWHMQLIDQSIRRLLAAIRDWSPVIRGSRNGMLLLIRIAEIRNGLMLLSKVINEDPQRASLLLISLRQQLRLLAHFLETSSGADPLRPEVLTSLAPLPVWSSDLDWATESSGLTFAKDWRERLRATQAAMQR